MTPVCRVTVFRISVGMGVTRVGEAWREGCVNRRPGVRSATRKSSLALRVKGRRQEWGGGLRR